MSASAEEVGLQLVFDNGPEPAYSVLVPRGPQVLRWGTLRAGGKLSTMPSRLAVFAYERDTGLPLAHLPCYAEVVVRGRDDVRPGAAGRELDDVIAVVLREDDPKNVADDAVRSRLTAMMEQELLRQLGPDAVEEFQREHAGAGEFLRGVVRNIRDAAGERALSDLPAEEFRQLAADAVRAQAAEVGLVPAPMTEPGTVVWAYPLGVVATDHVGYLSFDLARLPPAAADAVQVALEIRRQHPEAPRPAAVLVYPMGTAEPIDAISQGRGRRDAVVARLELARPGALDELPGLGMPAMQDPGLPDWRLSPSSFAHNPASLVGEDGCESLLPANVALQEQYLYQIVRLTDLQAIVPAAARDRVALGVVNDYRVAWYPLGHSLGQLLYSLPLAPGESVNLAVVDWTRRDDAQRKEQTTLDEQLVHDEHRDRTISETVDAAVHEYQHGSSFMGGIAGAAGGSMGMVSGGIAGSLGGATSNSSGIRNVSSDTVQKVSDNISQVSAAKRELQSTVVVHGTQAEREAIETRTVVNYNHSHALTILYYEVLRQFRVVTELSRRRPAVLVKVPTDLFTAGDPAKVAREHRPVLEAALLDARLAAGFAALDRIEDRRRLAAVLPPPPPPPPGPGDRMFVFFMFEMTTGGMFSAPMDDHGHYTNVVATILRSPPGTDIELLQADGGNVLSHRGSFRQGGTVDKFGIALPAGAAWNTFTAISFWIDPQGGPDQFVSFAHIKVTGVDGNGGRETLIDEGYEGGHLIVMDEGATIVLPTLRPPPPPSPAPRPAQEVQDDADRAALLAHLAEHGVYYSRAVTLGQNAAERTNALAAITLPDGSSVADKVDPRPLEMAGDQVAYACTDPAWSEQVEKVLAGQPTLSEAFDERLVGLPTRGVFAEAKLGHCNASELIDNTRFWDWQQSPVPHLAPEIAPVTAVTPQPVQQGLTPTGFPASLVNIVNPPIAPDPTGTTAALALLGTSNVFRDMSGRAEVADILKNLADNAVKIAGGPAGGASRTPSAGSGGGSAGGGTGATRGSAAVGGQRATPTQPSATNRDLQDLQQVLGQAQGSGLITPEAAQQAYGTALQSALQPADAAATTPRVTMSAATDSQIVQAGNVEFFNASDVDNYFRDVTGQTFSAWFAGTLANRGSWAGLSMATDAVTLARFVQTWDAFPPIVGSDHGAGTPGTTLVEFAALMAVFIHETGGNLRFRGAEGIGGYGHSGLSYPFDTFVIQRPGEAAFTKGSYNTGNGNHTAFTNFHDPKYLAAFGALRPTTQSVRDLEAWKGVVWPASVPTAPDAGTAFLQESDFYKFRGRGAIQSTGRAAYLPIVTFVRAYTGDDVTITAVRNRWATFATALGAQGVNVTTDDDFATVSTNADWDSLFTSVTIQAAAISGHNGLAGKHYLPLSSTPATLKGTARGSVVFLAKGIAGANDDYATHVRNRVVDFIGTLWATSMPAPPAGAGGADGGIINL